MQGYTLTGRTALFPSYEAFLNIVVSMCEQCECLYLRSLLAC